MILPLALVLTLSASLDADPEFKKGQEQVDAFDYEKAAATFDGIAKRPGIPDGDRAQALVWLGIACAELRDQARASIAFEDAVTADPLIVLPRDASPKIKALLEDARGRVRLRPKAITPVTTATPTTIPTLAPQDPQPPAPPPASGSSLVPVAIGTVVVGGVVAVAGGIVWGVGLSLRQQAIDAPFQSDAAALRDQSVATQIGGQVATGVGVAALVVGGVLFGIGAIE